MKRLVIFLSCLIIAPHTSHAKLEAVPFPKTYEDVSFQDRIQNETEGYKPFMDKRAYIELNIAPGEEIYTDSMIAQMEAGITTPDSQTHEHQASFPYNLGEYAQHMYHAIRYQTIGGGTVVENNIVVGASCYLPDTDRHFPNQILTTGRYEKVSPAFEKALITVFRKEGACGTIPNDPCGYTCYGIGSDPKCAGIVVSSRSDAEDWYYNNMWKKYDIDKLPDVISTDFFLATMASGPQTAYNQFRDFLGVSSSGAYKIDSEIIRAVNTYNGDIHNRWLDKRNAFLQNVAKRRYNGSVSNGYKNAIELKRKNGCHTRPAQPLYR